MPWNTSKNILAHMNARAITAIQCQCVKYSHPMCTHNNTIIQHTVHEQSINITGYDHVTT